MGCNCGKGKASAFVVKVPGQPDRTVTSEQAAQDATRGIRGASYRALATR